MPRGVDYNVENASSTRGSHTKEQPELDLDYGEERYEQLQFDLNEVENDFLKIYKDITKRYAKPKESKNITDYLVGAMGANFYSQPKVRRRLASEVATGLPRRDDVHMLDHRSPVLEAVKDDPRFAEQMQVMIDLDSTLFPLDRAMRELGVDIPTNEVNNWGADGDPVGDAILKEAGRTDLLYGKELTDKEQQEKIDILVDFFARLHADEELMKRAGVFEFAPEIISDLRKQGVKVHIVTHRSPSTTAATIAWLDAMGIEHDAFVCDLPHVADKIKYCQDNGIPVILDDKPQTIIDAEGVGIEAISLAWPYSKKALDEADGEEAACWVEMGHDTVRHLEEKIEERARELGVDLPKAISFESVFDFSKGPEKSTSLKDYMRYVKKEDFSKTSSNPKDRAYQENKEGFLK